MIEALCIDSDRGPSLSIVSEGLRCVSRSWTFTVDSDQGPSLAPGGVADPALLF